MNTRKGFTLVELLVVIAILAILSTVAVVGYTSYITRAETQAAATEAAHIDDAIVIALVSDKVAYVELTRNNATVYITFTRNASGNGYTAVESTTAPATGTAQITNIDSELLNRLSVNSTSGKLEYTSAKNVTVPVQ